MKAEKVIGTALFGGYNKNDVHDYIEHLERVQKTELDKQKEKIAELQAQIIEANTAKASLMKECAAKNEELLNCLQKIEDYQATEAAIRSAQKATTEQAEQILADAKQQANELIRKTQEDCNLAMSEVAQGAKEILGVTVSRAQKMITEAKTKKKNIETTVSDSQSLSTQTEFHSFMESLRQEITAIRNSITEDSDEK